ncbi:MAG: histone acetyltransferase, partial [Berryella intestinalis]|nr:histone acetyltransferase [Berryella intestinalis]
MEALLLDILALLKQGEAIDAAKLAALVRARNENVADVSKHLAKKRLFPFYLRVKTEDPARWRSWGIDSDLEKRL